MAEKFFDDFDFFWGLIERKENFSFARYADGEVMLMKGEEVNQNTQAFKEDKWSSPKTMTRVGKELIDSLGHQENNFYYAISSVNDNLGDYYFLKSMIKSENITFVNLWINANYNKTKKKYSELNREVNLISNHRSKIENFPFKIKKFIPFPDDCINFWGTQSEKFKEKLIENFSSSINELFFISCGPISEIIIDFLYKKNPNNSYIDVGSSIDEFVHGKKTRPYMKEDSQYYKMISKF